MSLRWKVGQLSEESDSAVSEVVSRLLALEAEVEAMDGQIREKDGQIREKDEEIAALIEQIEDLESQSKAPAALSQVEG